MAPMKRKRAPPAAEESDSDSGSDSGYSIVAQDDDDENMDISSALVGKKPRLDAAEDNDDDLQDFIQSSIAKRNVKGGTDIVKKVKGKTKITKGELGGGSFQSMGLHPSLLRSLTLQGFRIPTPIQRLSIPALLATPPRDLVGMARTGSGKTLGYMIPLVQRLGGRHSTTFGARSLILIPTRELALQILRVGKELARGWHSSQGDHAGDSKSGEDSKGQSLRWALVVGGEGLDEQFEMMTNNPDVIIATPGRLLHLIVEMNLDLKSVQYVVFDEADRLFEMGFETALNEILHRLPSSRQTLLFSATLPKSLVEFAKAGLQDPKLVRLDAESKISSDLKMAFFSVKQAEKEACLLSLLRDVIKVPLGNPKAEEDPSTKTKGKGRAKHGDIVTAPHQTLIFTATKHHVDYITTLLSTAGYAVSHIYGSLDQTARSQQMEQFRQGITTILVVTDVAARGIDIPVLENVINYDFPQGARVFVHRVGRTARAGRQGWAWSFVTNTELPYLLDLQLFLGRPLRPDAPTAGDEVFAENLILGTFRRESIDEDMEYVASLQDVEHSLPTQKQVMQRGQRMYERSQGKASPPSYKRAKDLLRDPRWMLTGTQTGVHPVLLRGEGASQRLQTEEARKALLQAVSTFKPAETVFEVGSKNNSATAALMKARRTALDRSKQRAAAAASSAIAIAPMEEENNVQTGKEVEMADEEDIARVFDTGKNQGFRDADFYLSYQQKDATTERGYSLSNGASFVEQARGAQFDLTGDEKLLDKQRKMLHWDKRKKRFVQGDGVGADNVKLVRTESGARLPATYRSGRFDEWKARSHTSLPKVGEAEGETAGRARNGQRFKHNKVSGPTKPLDKLRTDYERRVRQMKKKAEAGGGEDEAGPHKPGKGGKGPAAKVKKGARFAGKPMGRVKNELKTVDQIRKSRKTLEKRKAKNARPTRKSHR
ncbi:P-loop containing nucleoside triphosphate hydrolase protein [Schizophyllum amplum]|uniref:RNA helicase n=1 Tax=Schizophyllum amplum TaxID=97359 RepID=A0A550CYV1_9AGAR|nr:P-loop containing nucleoside triphosphate hydrolase protein [Auriculariopsis ampla]